MSDRQPDDDRRRQITTDKDAIRRWADERNAVPAYREDAEEGRRHRFFRESEVDEGYQERNWDTFFDDFESNDRAFVYHEDADDPFASHEIVARDEAAARATVSDRDVEEQLVEGETVTTEVTERTVVEREIVETETIESEVTDRRPVDSRITGAELVDWEVVDTDVDVDLEEANANVADRDVTLPTRGDDRVDYTDLDLETTVTGGVTAEVEERWRIDRETDERLTVESRVVDVDVEESDRVTDDSVETHVDAAGIQRSIVESDILGTGTTDTAGTTDTTGTMGDADATGPDVVGTDAIETTAVEDSEDLRFESQLVERRRYEDEITRRKRLTFHVGDVDVLHTETAESVLVGSDVVESDPETERTDDRTTAGADATTGTATDADATGSVVISEDDEGKTVVDDMGDTIGRVVDVEGTTLYVDTDAGFFERLEAALGWESRDEDAYPITADQIAEIDDRRVVLKHAAEERIDDDR